MYKIYGYLFKNGQRVPLNGEFVVPNIETAHELITKELNIQYYLIRLKGVKE